MQAAVPAISSTSRFQQSCSICTRSDIIFDSIQHELICIACGAIVAPGEDLAFNRDQREKTRNGLNTPLSYPNAGLSTKISQFNFDAHGGRIGIKQKSAYDRIRKQHRFALKNSIRNLTTAFLYLDAIKNKLILPDAALQGAAYNYRKALDLNLIKGRSIKAVIIACTYIACRELTLPKTLQEIAQAIDADAVVGGKCYRILVRRLNLESPRIQTDMYVSKFANILGIKGKAFKRALQILARSNKSQLLVGKNPCAVAAAALYVACEIEGVDLSQAKVAYASNLSIVSIHKRATNIRALIATDDTERKPARA